MLGSVVVRKYVAFKNHVLPSAEKARLVASANHCHMMYTYVIMYTGMRRLPLITPGYTAYPSTGSDIFVFLLFFLCTASPLFWLFNDKKQLGCAGLR